MCATPTAWLPSAKTKKMKYKLTDETLKIGSKTLFRIKALKSFGEVKEGDVGGWVESEKNLDHEGNAWVFGNAKVYDNALVSGNAWVYGNARVFGAAMVYDNAFVSSNARVFGAARVYGAALVSDDVNQ